VSWVFSTSFARRTDALVDNADVPSAEAIGQGLPSGIFFARRCPGRGAEKFHQSLAGCSSRPLLEKLSRASLIPRGIRGVNPQIFALPLYREIRVSL
jgi:hypothetical protein